MIGQPITHILKQHPATADIVGDRIYPLIIPLDQDIPAIVYVVNTTESVDTKHCLKETFNDVSTLELILLHRNYATLQLLIVAVRDALYHKNIIYNEIRIKDVRFVSGSDTYDNTTDTYIYRMTFKVYSTIKK